VFGKGKYKSVPVSQPAKVEDEEHKNIGPNLTANEMIIYDRLIIQVESIPKLFEHGAPKYDMVILDEIEADCSKILCLDGDFGNRAFDFVKEFNPIIIENLHIGKGNNICVVSMSSKFANTINNLYTAKDIRCILHTSKTDDTNKLLLKDVNNHWINYQIIIYTPSIEAGVNFDVPHVHKMFICLSGMSTSIRD